MYEDIELSAEQLVEYHQDADAFLAAYCQISKDQLLAWKAFNSNPERGQCIAITKQGYRCKKYSDDFYPYMEPPDKFVAGTKHYCGTHKKLLQDQKSLHTVVSKGNQEDRTITQTGPSQ